MTAVKESCSCKCGEEATEAELLKRLDEVIKDYRDKPGALIPVLQITQGMFGYLPASALKKISLGLKKSYSEVAGVVGFYSFFSTVPRGKYLVRVCLGTACYVRGGKRVLDSLKMLFSLDVGRCFGACGLAPTIMVNDDVHQRVKSLKIQELLDKYRNQQATA
jgi:NADH:ubiquinone oxidoreductase subunit E